MEPSVDEEYFKVGPMLKLRGLDESHPTGTHNGAPANGNNHSSSSVSIQSGDIMSSAGELLLGGYFRVGGERGEGREQKC